MVDEGMYADAEPEEVGIGAASDTGRMEYTEEEAGEE